MLGVDADHSDDTFPLDDLTLLANLFYGSSNSHLILRVRDPIPGRAEPLYTLCNRFAGESLKSETNRWLTPSFVTAIGAILLSKGPRDYLESHRLGFVPVSDTPTLKIVGRQFDQHAVSRKDANIVLSHLAGHMCKNRLLLIANRNLYPEHCVWQSFGNYALYFDPGLFTSGLVFLNGSRLWPGCGPRAGRWSRSGSPFSDTGVTSS